MADRVTKSVGLEVFQDVEALSFLLSVNEKPGWGEDNERLKTKSTHGACLCVCYIPYNWCVHSTVTLLFKRLFCILTYYS